ncbi:MAG TPA: DMT family transporter, partial [Albitalea sp.]|nr:DMT family transporter [Albitalea sp.]
MTRISARTAVLMTLPPLLWAGNAVVGRLAVGSVPPLTLNFLRWTLAMLLLLPLGWRVLRDPAAIAARWKHLLLIGLLGVGTYNSLQYLALVTTTPINVTLIAASMPVWMLLVGALLHDEHPTRRQIAGAVLSLAGVLLVIARGDPAAL